MIVNECPKIQNVLFVYNNYNYEWQIELSKNIPIHKVYHNKIDLLKYIRKGDTVYFPSMLLIDTDTKEQLYFLEKISEKGCNYKSCLEPAVCCDTAFGEFVAQILIAVAEYLPNIKNNYIGVDGGKVI
jgi:hypothetical protein